MTIFEAVQRGGPFMYVLLTAVIVSWPLSGVAVVLATLMRSRRVAFVAGVLGALVAMALVGVGVMGYGWSMAQVEQAIQMADPSYRDRLLEAGTAEASNLLHAGWLAASVPAVAAVLCFALGVRKEKGPVDDSGH